MGKIVLKLLAYSFLLFLALEVLIRLFHLHNERPTRFLDERNVEKWIPHQKGLSVTGNRKQNTGRYRINSLGFNSVYDEYAPSEKALEIALVGDSFIEGFHQNFDMSIGQKTEVLLNNEFKVYEFGYAGYDMADQLHLIYQYKDLFDKIDYRVIYMRFTDDLHRSTYTVSNRLSLNTPINQLMKKVKTVVYLKDIGLFDPISKKASLVKGYLRTFGTDNVKDSKETETKEKDTQRTNFIKLVDHYGFDKERNILLLDLELCSREFVDYLKLNQFKFINLSEVFANSKKPVTLIYDQHWNDHGRNLVSRAIANHITMQKEEN